MWPPGSQCLVMADQLSVLCLGWMIGSLNINNPVIPPSIIHQGSSFSSSSSDIVTPGSCVLSIFLSANKSILQTIGRNFSIVVNQSGYYSGKNISSVWGLCPDPGGCQCCHHCRTGQGQSSESESGESTPDTLRRARPRSSSNWGSTAVPAPVVGKWCGYYLAERQ